MDLYIYLYNFLSIKNQVLLQRKEMESMANVINIFGEHFQNNLNNVRALCTSIVCKPAPIIHAKYSTMIKIHIKKWKACLWQIWLRPFRKTWLSSERHPLLHLLLGLRAEQVHLGHDVDLRDLQRHHGAQRGHHSRDELRTIKTRNRWPREFSMLLHIVPIRHWNKVPLGTNWVRKMSFSV